MIQRIQSVYLFLVFVLSIVMLFCPLAEYTLKAMPPTIVHFNLLGFHTMQNNIEVSGQMAYAPLIFDLIIGLMAMIIIFFYKNRKLQIRLCRFNILFTIALVGLIIAIAYNYNGYFVSHNEYYFSGLIPIGMIVLNLLAMRAIKKDDDLVKSVDRLR